MADDAGEGPWLVVGLGNPGSRYAGNRHNVGAMVVAQLAADLGATLSAHRSRAQVAETRLPPVGGRPGERVVLAVPTAYMNESGGQVTSAVRFFKTDPARLLVVHDELDLPFADLMLKRGGGEGGHNGLRSISQSLGTKDYCRLRVGIGRPPGRMDPADFVLRDFSPTERKELPFVIGDAADAVLLAVQEGWDRAQEKVNGERRSRQGSA
jgi:PTH1 family peptidyl-tRNA hydrolase